MSINKYLDITGMIFGIAGAIMVGQLCAWGFLSFIIGSSHHGLLGYRNKNYGMMFTCIIFILIDVFYLIRWLNI